MIENNGVRNWIIDKNYSLNEGFLGIKKYSNINQNQLKNKSILEYYVFRL